MQHGLIRSSARAREGEKGRDYRKKKFTGHIIVSINNERSSHFTDRETNDDQQLEQRLARVLDASTRMGLHDIHSSVHYPYDISLPE